MLLKSSYYVLSNLIWLVLVEGNFDDFDLFSVFICSNILWFKNTADVTIKDQFCSIKTLQIVNRVNIQAVDAVFIVGDTVDAPRDSIENRVKPLR